MAQILNFFDTLNIQRDFFDDARLDSRLNKETMQTAILRRCGTLLPVYTDTRIFKYFSDNFFDCRYESIKKLLDTTEFDYNPIDNYNRHETTTDTKTGTDIFEAGKGKTTTFEAGTGKTTTFEAGQSETHNDTIIESNRKTVTPNLTVENKVSAFDSSTYQPSNESITTGTETTVDDKTKTDTLGIHHSGTDTTTETSRGQDTTTERTNGQDRTNYNNTRTIETDIHGNIGVMSTQEMIKQEREIDLFSIYEWIAIEFEVNFFVALG